MTADRPRRLRELFATLVDLDPTERMATLDRECADDPDLRREVEALLAADADHEGTLADIVVRAVHLVDSTTSDDPPRTLGKYTLLEQIGAGGMGVVWRALDTSLDRQVALKVLPRELARHPDRLERFRREARALAGLNHPNIVTLHSVEEVEGVHFLTMELITGRTLADTIGDSGMAVEDWWRAAVPLVDALAAAHRRGVIHRDLKPGNVMIDTDGRLRVLDFGLAKLLHPPSSLTGTAQTAFTSDGTVLGTAPYMSPEQIRGAHVDARTDLFSLGVVLHEMATGRRPFAGDSLAELSSAILRDPPPNLRQVRPELPQRIAEIVGRCLEKDREDRHCDAEDLRRDLATVQTGGVARPTGQSSPAWTTRLRLGAFVALAAVAIGISTWIAMRADDPLLEPATDPGTIRSLVVLPFTALGSDDDLEYLAAGLSDTLVTDLATLDSLRVISRTSAVRAAATGATVSEIGRMLNVEGVVDGTVTVDDGRVLVNVQLVDAASDDHLWAAAYGRRFDNVVVMQREIARAVAAAIQIQLDDREEKALAAAPKVDREAYEAYLRGRYYWSRRTQEDVALALEHFEQSIDLDPVFAPAWSGLADAYLTRATYFWEPVSRAMPRARDAAERALEIDPRSAHAHASLGEALTSYYWKWEEAEDHLRRAVELEPGYATGHQRLAELLGIHGRAEPAIRHARRARSLDPLAPVMHFTEGKVLYYARRYDDATTVFDAILAERPDFVYAHFYRALSRVHTDGPAAAAAGLDGVEGPRDLRVMRTILQARAGRPEEARAFARSLQAEDGPVDPFLSASFETLFGDHDHAVQLLHRAEQSRDWRITFLAVEPMFDALRGHSGFQQLLHDVGLPVLEVSDLTNEP